VSLRRVLGDEAVTAFFIGLEYHVEALGIGRD
jgi:hypothetical protein